MAVIGYLRVSTDEQSIGAQRHSIGQTHKVETWFADEGVSGAVKAALFPKSTIKPQLPQPQVTVTLGAF